MFRLKIDKKSLLQSMIISAILIGIIVLLWLYPLLKSTSPEQEQEFLTPMGTIVIITFYAGFFLISLYVSYLFITGLKIPKEERMRRREIMLKESREHPYGRNPKEFWHNYMILIMSTIFFLFCVIFMVSLTNSELPWMEIMFILVVLVSFPLGYYIWKKRKE